MSILIPSRSGSKRLPEKNIRVLSGKPLLAIAIEKAIELVGSTKVFVSTDSAFYAKIAEEHGARVPSLRPMEMASDASMDIDWVWSAITEWKIQSTYVAIVRPTSPFLNGDSILKALEVLKQNPSCDSIRAIRKVSEHPGKMWRTNLGPEIIPLFPQIKGITPSHSRPTQSLEELYVQCGAFEIARLESVLETNSISGDRILGHELSHPESLDINSPEDFLFAGLISENTVSGGHRS
jgi:CMP-N,N'-diacetyllegionaminic acid synthase